MDCWINLPAISQTETAQY